jgi:hypothetical protein
VHSKSLDAAKEQGQAFVEMLEEVAQMSRSLDTGRRFDATG